MLEELGAVAALAKRGVRGQGTQAIPGMRRQLRGICTPSTTATYGPSAGTWASVWRRKQRVSVS
jgi:hypothetical protein